MPKEFSVKVSVIIPTFNASDYIQKTLESVLNQTEPDLEVIVSDDLSTDNTVSIVEGMIKNDSRIKLIKNDKNRGPSYARNRAISKANGQWVALLDADDFYHQDRLKELTKIGEECNADLVADNMYYVDENGEKPVLAIKTQSSNKYEIISIKEFIQNDFPNESGFKYGFLQPLMRKNFLYEKNITYDEKVRIGEDFILCVECLLNGAKFVLCYDAFYYYRFVENSLINTSFAENKILSAMGDNNLKLIFISRKIGNNDAISLLQQRQHLIEHAKLYTEITGNLKKHKFIEPLKKIIMHPGSWGYFYLMAFQYIKRSVNK
ncbi:MAG: glycosyltransferase family 2 protein [Methylobacter sp.]